ncbi:Fic family protein [TM7 phylum sp. oral taxon 349]|jgi:filamentation induced by cAMP protein fic|nr:Fic family protein [TM7 phylum sp. oral taxon 349]
MTKISNKNPRIGVYRPQPEGFKAFVLESFPPKDTLVFSSAIQQKHAEAMRLLGKLDGITALLPDRDYFLEMFVRKDASSSSQIEGTQASISDAIEALNIERRNDLPQDVDDILHYIEALNYGLERAKDFPFSLRFIRELHEKLMIGARNTHNSFPGEFRRTQNWIGGTRPDSARFVPPPVREMNQALDDLEKFIHADDEYLPLIKAGLLHAQFETIHPFLDGNGRTGRMLVTMFLWHRRLLEMPVLYLSTYFKKHQEIYYEKLNAYHSESGNVEEWVEFFLDGVLDTANSSIETCKKITELRERDMRKVQKLGKATAPKTLDMIRFLYKVPTVGIADVVNQTGYSRPSAYKLIDRLVGMNILYPADENDGYGKKYTYKDYIEIFTEDRSLG